MHNSEETAEIVMPAQSGVLHVYADRVVLERRNPGCVGMLFSPYPVGSKTIPFDSITAIQIKEQTFTVGFIQFTVPGGRESVAGATEAVKDENTITFNKPGQVEICRQAHDLIMAKKREKSLSMGQVKVTAATGSTADELRKIKDLLDEGVLTPEEFSEQKRRLLADSQDSSLMNL